MSSVERLTEEDYYRFIEDLCPESRPIVTSTLRRNPNASFRRRFGYGCGFQKIYRISFYCRE